MLKDDIAGAIKYWAPLLPDSRPPTLHVGGIIPLAVEHFKLRGKETSMLFYLHRRRCSHLRVAAQVSLQPPDVLTRSSFTLLVQRVLRRAGIREKYLRDLRLSVRFHSFF